MKLVPNAARVLQLFLLCLSMAFVIITWLELSHDNSLQSVSPVPQAGAGDTKMTQHNKASDLPPLSDFASIIERPLFMSNRRPETKDDGLSATAGPVSPASGPTRSGNLALSGIVLTGDKAIALVTGTDHKIHRLEVGESIDDWSVKAIRNKEIVLTRGNETRNLELKVEKSPAPGSNPQRRRITTPRTLSTRQAAGTKNTEQVVTPSPPVRQRTSGAENEVRDKE